jgi:Cellulase (glycosyl hydrolase family 5)
LCRASAYNHQMTHGRAPGASLTRPRLSVAALFAAIATLLASAGPAIATPGLTLGFSGGAGIIGGMGPLSGAQWMARARADGASIVRVGVSWSSVAPSTRPGGFNPSNPASPGYSWASVDASVEAASAQGMKVLLTIQGAPSWAEDGAVPSSATPGSWRPDPAQLAAFATAIATRYDGHYPNPATPGTSLPRVTDYQAWNEPNLSIYLAPQWVRSGSTWAPEAPTLLRAMENSFYSAIKAVSRSDFVVLAGTAPFGDLPGGQRMQPVAFYRALFCLSSSLGAQPCSSAVSFDAIDHHPYGIDAPTMHALNPDDASIPDIDKITKVLHAAQRTGRALPHGPKQVWTTEIGWNSKPPESSGVPIATQARWLEQSLYLLWSQGVSTVMWLQIVDIPPVPGQPFSFWDSGIYYQNGRAKPAATAYRFPFVTQRLSSSRVLAWGRAPSGGHLLIQRESGSTWRTVAGLHVGAHQVFDKTLSQSGAGTFRAQLAGATSLTWSQS